MMPRDCPPLNVNFFDPAIARDPYPVLERLRAEAPAYFWEMGHGPVFLRWRDVSALFRETRLGHDPTFGAGPSAEMKAAFPDFAALRESDLFTMPSTTHARVRRLLNPIFGPRAVEVHRPKIEKIIGELLDRMPREGVINAFQDYARHYPHRVISSILNIPKGHEAEFLQFADALTSVIFPNVTPEVFASFMPAVSRGMGIVRECIQERRAHPMEDDLLTQLINACDDQDRLTEGELVALVAALIVGGTDTTTHLTTYALHELHRHPEQLAALRQDPSLARNVLDETLRYNTFGRTFLPRFVMEDFEYEGMTLARGTIIYLSFMTAFRDPEYLPDGAAYDIRRKHTGSPWFGFGPHFCLGASLARLEGERALQMFFERYPATELAGEPVYGTHFNIRDIVNLPIRVGTSA